MASEHQRAFSTLRVGETFGAGRGGETPDVGIWCRVDGFRGDLVKADVINGGWSLEFDRRTGRAIPTKGMEHLSECEVLFTGLIPRHLRHDYNDAIDHMQRCVDGTYTPDKRLLDLLEEAEGTLFDKEGFPLGLERLSYGATVDLIGRIDAAMREAAPDAPGRAELAALRGAAFTDLGLAGLEEEALDAVRGPLRAALGMPEFEPPEPEHERCVPY